MAYNAVAQGEHELPSDSDDSRGPSPQPHAHPHSGTSFEQLPLDADHIGAGEHLQRAETDGYNGFRSLGSMVRSMTTTSYDMVESDDYEVVADPQSPTGPDFNSPSSPDKHADTLRTPTTEHSVPLNHPTPGLQSLQGAYVHNVERLENAAERLSLSSADIGSEIRKMGKRRSSAGSASVSNYASQDAMSHRDSIQSGTRLAQVSEQHALEEFPENPTTRPLAHAYLPPLPDAVPLSTIDINKHQHARTQYNSDMGEVEMERPLSAASGDTYRQARILFNDFDGVHYVPMDKGIDLARRVSLTRPPLASRPQPYKQPQEGENMVFYPAPVPMTINLPPKLSQRPDHTQREKRRTQLLDAVSPDKRKSAPWLAEQDQAAGHARRRTAQPADMPSHLRASVFFEPPSATLDIDPSQTSAVATLDSILDASTTAPVTAFTDHPFAGPVGPEVYSSSKHGKLSKDVSGQRKKLRPKSTLDLGHRPSVPDFRSASLATHNVYPTTEAAAAETHETTSLRKRDSESSSESEGDSEESSGSSEEDSEGTDDEELHFTGQPATLIAELEQRKHDLKQRRRTAPNAVGMQSTLLQLEAVAAKQSEHRRQKPVALAWENPDAHPNDQDDDDDVPLGMLFPEKAQHTDETRPLGLMEKREMEESEPLSRRRARLRGEPLPQPIDQRPMTMYSQGTHAAFAQDHDNDSGNEGETLGQRQRRLKGHERNISKADTDFTTEILAEFDHLKEDENKNTQNEPSQEDETLAQRRARLRKEASEKRNSGLKIPRYRRSMADILHIPRPSTVGQQSLMQETPGPIHQRSLDHRMSMQHLPVSAGPPKTAAAFSQYQAPSLAGPYGYPMAHPNTFYSDAILGNGNLSYAMPPNLRQNTMRQEVDPGQRAVIDRWRQSIV
ncbi:uncharacterized protein DSM5745_11582 [Aspergillus mulundensis]|uniref:Uncharacterized protein n=1 Tax=Aspergillus mulundensis TaxID=1810919 RepID=A0A3D8Q6K9_9EURO|nr:Uncharacterized protein DSM5745_11582 [Aspergillus mulundensis]RDW57044.1 Uncharacterized protein DSM5745_11582 [Aspergillus mulundensis]